MSFQVLAKADRSRIMLLPLRDGTALFEGYLRLKDMPQGPRAFKFLVKTDTEKYFPPEDAIKLLRQAGSIFIARGEEAMEKKFLDCSRLTSLATGAFWFVIIAWVNGSSRPLEIALSPIKEPRSAKIALQRN